MSKSHFTKKELRYEHDHSQVGKIEAYIRRFHNIKELREAFEKTEGYKTVNTIRDDMEKKVMEESTAFEEVEKKFLEERKAYELRVNDMLFSMLFETEKILKEFEKNYAGNK